MSKLSKFIGQSKEVEVRGEIIKLFPLTVKEMGLLEKMSDIGKIDPKDMTDDQDKEVIRLGKELLKSAYKEEQFTDEELDGMDLDLYSDLFALVMENTYEQKDGKGLTRIRELKAKVSQEQKS